MIFAQIVVFDGSTDRNQALTVPLSPGYGSSPELALELLTLALTAAEWPLVLKANSNLVRFVPGSIREIRTWEAEQ